MFQNTRHKKHRELLNMTNMKEYFKKYKSAGVALSGGADSTCVLKEAAKALGAENVIAFTSTNSHMFNYQVKQAEKIALHLGVRWIPVLANIDPSFYDNPPSRCYICKMGIFSEIKKEAKKLNLDVIVDGSNKDDHPEHRPGMKALEELDISSPLKELDLGKEFVEESLSDLGDIKLNTVSESCIASRIDTGKISGERLECIEEIEDKLRDDYPGIRVRFRDEGIFVAFKNETAVKQNDWKKIFGTIRDKLSSKMKRNND